MCDITATLCAAAAFLVKKFFDDGPGEEVFGTMIMNIPNIEAVGEDKCMQFKTDATTKIKTAAR